MEVDKNQPENTMNIGNSHERRKRRPEHQHADLRAVPTAALRSRHRPLKQRNQYPLRLAEYGVGRSNLSFHSAAPIAAAHPALFRCSGSVLAHALPSPPV